MNQTALIMNLSSLIEWYRWVNITEIEVTVAVPLRPISSVANITDVGDVFPTVAPNEIVWLEPGVAEGWSSLGEKMAWT